LSNLLQGLRNLQMLDDRLTEIQQKKQDIPSQINALEKAFEDEKNEFESHQKQIKDASLRQRQYEKDLQEGGEQVKKKQARLLEAKTNEEYRALVKEIEFTQESHSKIEDEILMIFDEIDSLKKDLSEKEAAVNEKEKKLQSDKQRLQQEMVTIDEEQKKIVFERKQVIEGIPEDIMANYEKIKARRAGQAVVIIEKNVCPGCNLAIPPQTINEVLQTGEIRYCPHCLRIIYCETLENV